MNRAAEGMRHVLVNGAVVIADGGAGPLGAAGPAGAASMSVPILMITGFLGAGKTTLVNHILVEPQGRRLAVVVNDFGTVDIDAQLLAGLVDGVVSLKNGCVCCSLQVDLLQTLSKLLRREPVPDAIVLETSGVSDPTEIVRALLDPIIWQAAALDAVICVVDARQLADRADLPDDALWQAQVRAADFVALTKTDLVDGAKLAQVRASLQRLKPNRVVHETLFGRVAPELLFSAQLYRPATCGQAQNRVSHAGVPDRQLDDFVGAGRRSFPDCDQPLCWPARSGQGVRPFRPCPETTDAVPTRRPAGDHRPGTIDGPSGHSDADRIHFQGQLPEPS